MENNHNKNIITTETIIEYAKFKLRDISEFNYFVFEGDLYIKLLLRTDIQNQPTCYNVTQSCISYLNLDTYILLCANVTINYNLWIKKNENIL